MKKNIYILTICFLSYNIASAQKSGLSLLLGGDYWQTTFVNEEFFLGNVRFGSFTSIYGYRIGVSYHLQLIDKFSIATKIGYTLGGFDGYEHQYSVKINQGWLSLTPQYQLNRLVKLNAGGMLNFNFPNKNNFLQKNISPINFGVSGGVSLILNRFEVGCQYTHFLNAYYDYKKLLPDLPTSQKQYWNVMGVFVAYRIFGKNPNNL